ncbi:MAG: metallophosphoesterase [Candidatus Hydrogenedentes bacterium]|nr:metallophosphoesterase [Candidatus Hydrogenedentota bacterium]
MTNARFKRRDFLKAGAASVGAVILGSAFSSDGRARAETGPAYGVAQLVIPHPSRLRILQFTDLHLFADEVHHESVDRQTCETMRELVKTAKPDLVMVTGDLWPENRDGMGEAYMQSAIERMEAMGVPWGFVWGNHDQLPDYAAGHAAFENAKNSLYRGAATDGNYVIDILDQGTRRVWQLICLNSHEYGVKIAPELQEKLTAVSTPPVPRIAFFHIPLKQYDTVWKNGTAAGVIGEDPCIADEDGSALAFLKSIGVTACFCGHDHVNDYSGVVDGIELVYGRATGAGGYGVEILPKGGKLITINCRKKQHEWVSLTPDGKRWTPKPGECTDRRDDRKG